MKSHLNIFNTHTNVNQIFQPENDLTKAFAISLQEDPLFFHEVFKEIVNGTNIYNELFESLNNETFINIDIQKRASQILNFDHIFAISLSDSEFGDFWEQNDNQSFDPICDLVIQVNNIVLVFETKRDNVSCTAQLYNQILNIINSESATHDFNKKNYGKIITPIDFNWSKLMAIAYKVSNFERTMNSQNRFLSDFISLVKHHNFRWLPEQSISTLKPTNKNAIERRLESTIEEVAKKTEIRKLNYNDRIGLEFYKPWAKEILFIINYEGNLEVYIYPGNTKKEGYHLFENTPNFSETLNILGTDYKVKYNYHIKFTSFQKYFQGLYFSETDLKKPLYTTENFKKYTGRKKRGKQWDQLELLFDKNLNYNWKKQCDWKNSIVDSGKNQFDISFGYEVYIQIPFQKLQELDQNQYDLTNLINLVLEIHQSFSNDLLLKPLLI